METGSIFVVGCLLSVSLIVTKGQAQETSPSEAPLLGSSTTETLSAEPVIAFTAERRIKQTDRLGRSNETKGQIYSHGQKVRFEWNDAGKHEVALYDYKESKEYRLYKDDRIYFESELSNKMFYRARREGLIQAEEDPAVKVTRLFLGETVWDGRPCEITLKVRTIKRNGRPLSDYTLLWEALDLDRHVVRVAYYRTARMFIIIEYRDAKQAPTDPTLFELPEDYLNFTPY